MSDSEDDVIVELGDEALVLDPLTSESVLVFRLKVPDANVALGTINIMFRGDAMDQVKDVFLCVIVDSVPYVVGTTREDPEMSDSRILLVKEWTNKLPLPLEGLVNRLAIVVHHTGITAAHVKFGADVVRCVDALCNIKWKKTSGDIVLHFQNQLTSLDGFDYMRKPAVNVIVPKTTPVSNPTAPAVSNQRAPTLRMRPPSSHVPIHVPCIKSFSPHRIPWNCE